MKMVFLPSGSEATASSRYKVYQVSPLLEKLGVECEVLGPKTPLGERLARFFARDRAVVYVQRLQYDSLFVAAAVALKKLLGTRLVYDVDDAVFLYAPLKTRLLVQASDLVLAGSHFVYDYCRKLNPRTALSLSCVDIQLFKPARADKKKEGLVLGWCGNPSGHEENLRLLVEPLKELASRGTKLEFRAVGFGKEHPLAKEFAAVPGLRTLFVPFIASERVPQALAEFDVGLVPLVDNPWCRGKYSIKVLEYMACGVPVVASRVGENVHLVEDGKTGFLAASPQEWAEQLSQLCANPKLRERMAANARRFVEEKYDLEDYAKNLVRLLREKFG